MFDTHGYPLECHEVQTEDGYILKLILIPRSKSDVETESVDGLPKVPEPIRPAVLLVHGFLCCADFWLINSPEKALPYMLSDEGHDVWIANCRGTPESKSHISLPTESKKYWDFSFDEIARFDVPAMINYILETSGNANLSYIGHSMGCTVFFAAMSIHKNLSTKIKIMVALAPAVFLKNLRIKWIKLLLPLALLTVGKLRRVYRKQLLPYTPMVMAKTMCRPHFLYRKPEKIARWMLKTTAEMSANFGKDQVDKAGYTAIAAVYPASTSMKVLAHLSQAISSGKCQSFDYGKSGNLKKYGQRIPPSYDISKVDVPVITFCSEGDELCTPTDVTRLADELPNVVRKYELRQPQFWHNDFIVGKDAAELVYQEIISAFKKSVSVQ